MSINDDRLFNLLPSIYRQRDAQQGYPLKALLRVIAEQVDIVEDDITQLYDNWFIETCADWVVPYIGDLIGYHQVHQAGDPSGSATPSALERAKILVPRREVANTIRNRRRKGTVAILESLARETAGWSARIVEYFRYLGATQHLAYPKPDRGRLVNLRDRHALDLIGTPFDPVAHTVDVATRNIPSVGVYVWRLKGYPVTWTQASCVDNRPNCYTFSILGNDAPLFTLARPGTNPDHVADELDVPLPIRRRLFEVRDDAGHTWANPALYGPCKSIEIRVDHDGGVKTYSAREVLPADLNHWHYQPPAGRVAVDPQTGRLAFRQEQTGDVWVRYQYGFSADIGGGEYERPILQPDQAKLFSVGTGKNQYGTVGEAVKAAHGETNAVIEITESRLYEEHIRIVVPEGGRFQLRAAEGKRPIIQIPDRRASRDAFRVELGKSSHFTLDGVMVSGRAVHIRGVGDAGECLPSVVIRHCTLVPGWAIDVQCRPSDAEEPSLELRDTCARITIEHSILGSIEVSQNEAATDPIQICISDSIVDATGESIDVLSGPSACSPAYAVLRVARTTMIGHTHVHAIQLAEDTIFYGHVEVVRRQTGCMRFCYVPAGSLTPRRYECQPDLVVAASDSGEKASETLRVQPQFNSTRFGSPVYCQLSLHCAAEISAGANDESEMGAFHDLYQPQRAANLRVRLNEYLPASTDVEIIYAS